MAGATQMEQANTVAELKALLKADYNPVMHLIDGENLSAKDFRGKRFELNGIKYKLEEVRIAYPVMVVDGKPATDFYLKLFCRNGHEKHEVLVCFPHEKQQQALDLYYDLLELKEPPMRILYLIVRQFNGILQVKDLMSRGISGKEIASKIGAAPFVVGKYQAQAKYFEMNTLLDALNECAKTEEAVKQGRLNDRLGVELIIIKYSK